MTSSIFRVASIVVPLLVLDVVALSAGCGDHPDGSPLLDCNDDGGGNCNSSGSAGGSGSGGGGTTIGSGNGDDTTGTGNEEGDGGTTGTTGITDGSGGGGNILPTDTGSTGSLPTNTE